MVISSKIIHQLGAEFEKEARIPLRPWLKSMGGLFTKGRGQVASAVKSAPVARATKAVEGSVSSVLTIHKRPPANAITQKEVSRNLRSRQSTQSATQSAAQPPSIQSGGGNQPIAKPKTMWSKMPGGVKSLVAGTVGGGALLGGGILYGAAKTPSDIPDPYERY